MTLQATHRAEVGVRELHDRLSDYLNQVEQGAELVVTRRGKPVATITGAGAESSLEALVERGLVAAPTQSRQPRWPKVEASVSDLVVDQRR